MSGLEREEEPAFPPLFRGLAVAGSLDPMAKAVAEAELGRDPGLVVHAIAADRLAAALVMAPEVPLEEAMAALPICGVGFQNALGALAPPEVAVHLEWGGGIRVNGASCGRLRAAVAETSSDAVPDWLVIGLEIPLLPVDDAPGETPDRTSLTDEGCGGVSPTRLLEAWARHTLVWLNRWEGEGVRPVHAEWRGLAHGVGEEVTVAGVTGVFVGVDENFGLLLRRGGETSLIPISDLAERR